MSDEEDEEEREEVAEAAATPLAEARRQLDERCRARRIDVRHEEQVILGQDATIVQMPNGRSTRDVYLWRAGDIDAFLALPFEDFTFIGPYEAIAAYKNGSIECAIRILDGRMLTMLSRAIYGGVGTGSIREFKPVVTKCHPSGAEMSLGPRSSAFDVFYHGPGYPLTLKITGVSVSQHDAALELLERLAGSLFFQLDMSFGVPLGLARRRNRPARRRTNPRDPNDLQFPSTEFDAAPLSLYWYGRAATGMPLLQFLAYYQVLEFYFPMHSQAEAQRRIQTLLKDPTFRVDRDFDINRVITAARISSGAYGDERAQLRATINECVGEAELREFFVADDERKRFFATKTKGLTTHRIPIDSPTADLRNDTAERVYGIRCKIVHTKSGGRDGDLELLLPFSPEADLLYHDIELVGFLATRALIRAGSPVVLP